MNKYMLYWWFGFCVQVLAAVTALHYGIAYELLGKDPFFITSFILILHVGSSLATGWYIFRKENYGVEPLWFIADAQFTIGMLGTLVGFIYMFNHAFAGGSVGDMQQIKDSIAFISTGMGVAIRATFLGLLCGLLLKVQLLILDKRINEQ